VEFVSHSTLHCQTDVPDREPIPISTSRTWSLVNHVSSRKMTQHLCGCAVPRSGLNLTFFGGHQTCEFRLRRTEAQFSVKPERARVDRLVIVKSQLIRVYRNASHSGYLI